jgi:diguanylate cyclase (GGDEF)-like protein
MMIIVSLPVILKPIANLNKTLREQKTRSQIKSVDPAEFYELSPLVETLLDYVEWAQNQQHVSAAIHQAFRKRIEHRADYDRLTGLFNRHYLESILPPQMDHTLESRDSMSLIMLDVDHFKNYNDTHGHPEGDKVLSRVAEILRKNVREKGREGYQDTCCRYGGEEFTVILPNTPTNRAMTIAERIRKAIEDADFPHEQTQPNGHVTVSLGVATCPLHATTPAGLVECADKALYLAKHRGRNRICRFDEVAAEGELDEIDRADAAGRGLRS